MSAGIDWMSLCVALWVTSLRGARGRLHAFRTGSVGRDGRYPGRLLVAYAIAVERGGPGC